MVRLKLLLQEVKKHITNREEKKIFMNENIIKFIKGYNINIIMNVKNQSPTKKLAYIKIIK